MRWNHIASFLPFEGVCGKGLMARRRRARKLAGVKRAGASATPRLSKTKNSRTLKRVRGVWTFKAYVTCCAINEQNRSVADGQTLRHRGAVRGVLDTPSGCGLSCRRIPGIRKERVPLANFPTPLPRCLKIQSGAELHCQRYPDRRTKTRTEKRNRLQEPAA